MLLMFALFLKPILPLAFSPEIFFLCELWNFHYHISTCAILKKKSPKTTSLGSELKLSRKKWLEPPNRSAEPLQAQNPNKRSPVVWYKCTPFMGLLKKIKQCQTGSVWIKVTGDKRNHPDFPMLFPVTFCLVYLSHAPLGEPLPHPINSQTQKDGFMKSYQLFCALFWKEESKKRRPKVCFDHFLIVWDLI